MGVKGVFNGVQYTKVITPTCTKWVSPQSKFNRDIFPKFQAANKNLREKGQIEWTWVDYKLAYLSQKATAKQRSLFA
jgi:hypothetical protein